MDANIILDRLPDTVTIGGEEYQIYADFRTSILFEVMMRSNLPEGEKLSRMLSLYYPVIPDSWEEAVERIVEFYNCGEKPQKPKQEKNKTRREFSQDRVAYSFEQDAPYIYAAFLSEYGINLQKIPSKDLHWWEFLALMESLPEEHKIKRIMYWRTCDTRGMSRKEVQHINEMRKRYELKDDLAMKAKITLAQRNQKLKDYVRRRFEEVKGSGKEPWDRD